MPTTEELHTAYVLAVKRRTARQIQLRTAESASSATRARLRDAETEAAAARAEYERSLASSVAASERLEP
jgi:hypothetical protein